MAARLPPRQPSAAGAQTHLPPSRDSSPRRQVSPYRPPPGPATAGPLPPSVRTKSPARPFTADHNPPPLNTSQGKPTLPASDVQSRIPIDLRGAVPKVALPEIPMKDRKSLASVAATIQKGAREAAQEANRRRIAQATKKREQANRQAFQAFGAFAGYAGGSSTATSKTMIVRNPSASIVRPSPSSQLSAQSQTERPQAKAEWPLLLNFLENQKRARQGKGAPWTWISLLEVAEGCTPQDRTQELNVTWVGFLPQNVQHECPEAIATISFSCLIWNQRKAFMGTIGKSPWSNPQVVKAAFVEAQKAAQTLHPTDLNARKAAIVDRLKVIMWRLPNGTPQIGLKYVPRSATTQPGGGSSTGSTR